MRKSAIAWPSTEYLDYIEALITRDPVSVEAACRIHLTLARKTLLASVGLDPRPEPTGRRPH